MKVLDVPAIDQLSGPTLIRFLESHFGSSHLAAL